MHKQQSNNIIKQRACRWLLAVAIAWTALTAVAQDGRPLVIVCDWDFAPYEYAIDGKAAGFNVDVIHTILKELGIPHEFQAKARKQCVSLFKDHQADLIVDFRGRYKEGTYYPTVNPLGYYHIMAAHKKGEPDVTSVAQLKDCGTIAFNGLNDSIASMILGDGILEAKKVYCSARDALSSVSDGVYNYFIWGEEPLKWKIKELNLTDIVYKKLPGVPSSEIHIVGYDKQLIDAIDSQFARLVQRGVIERLSDRWFHPERTPEHSPRTVITIALAVFLFSVFIIVLHIFTRIRVKAAIQRNEEMGAMMHQALSMGNYSVLMLDLKQNRITNQHGNILPQEGISLQEMMQYIHPDDREAMIKRRRNRTEEKEQVKTFNMRWNTGTREKPVWQSTTGYSYPEFDEHHRPVNIVIISRDITDEVEHEEHDRETASRYLRMFDSTVLAMSFYDKNGRLIDLNEKMKELCGLSDKNLEFFRTISIFDVDMLRGDFQPDSKEDFYVGQHMLYPELGIDKYIELRVSPTLDENGELMYYILTVSDVTNERNLYMDLKQQNEILQQTEDTNCRYEQEMRTLMENCNMYVWHVDLNTNIISFSRSLGTVDFTRTMQEHLESIYEEERKQAYQTVQNLKGFDSTFSVIHHFRYTPIDTEPTWYATSGMALKDEKGNVTSLIGIVRNVTDLMEAQEQLKKETARAENSGILKSTFLANMTHEIRTPLNAIVGFTDLLHMVEAPEERKEFVRIIRNNCDMLMRLINDIFEASTMDVKPLEIKPEEVDFALFFNVISQSLAQRVQEPGVEFIVDNPYQQFITTLDKGRMQQVITNFVTNAVKYTHQGHIRIGYRYQDSGLYMYCEDTGTGIPKEKQQSVFERFVKLNDFVQGTGLGLSICKSIAERSNGRIGVDSEGEGHGSNFWIWVPCCVLSQTPASDSQ